jgi:hypothetical protein
MNENKVLNDALAESFSKALAKQPAFARRKDSIRDFTGLILQASNILITVQAGLPVWATALIAVLIGVVQVLHAATSEAPLAPSQERKILESAKELDLINPVVKDMKVIETLANILDAVNNQRKAERGLDGYGKAAIEVAPEGERPVVRTLDALRAQVSEQK